VLPALHVLKPTTGEKLVGTVRSGTRSLTLMAHSVTAAFPKLQTGEMVADTQLMVVHRNTSSDFSHPTIFGSS